MPLYEYKCQICEHVTERLQKTNDSPAVTCPMCGRDTLKRVMSAGVFNLKGGGFYKGGLQ